jgi:hypothetical protein
MPRQSRPAGRSFAQALRRAQSPTMDLRENRAAHAPFAGTALAIPVRVRKPLRGALLVAVGLVAAGLAALLALLDQSAHAARFSLALPIALGAIALAAIALGIGALNRRAAAQNEDPVSYRHTFRLFAVVGAGLLVALVTRCHAVPDSFGERGFYRGDARREAMVARAPRFQGDAACLECHRFQGKMTAKDVHRTVRCEDCHGPGDLHVKDQKTESIAVDRSRDGCLVCHRLLSARPGAFAQVSWREHFKQRGVTDDTTACLACHDAHEPLFLEKPVAQARLHPLIHRCRDCHTGKVVETAERPSNHPSIFECAYCHAAIAKDFAKRPHGDIACTSCHLFIKESDFAGRIVLDQDPRFCLLCHARAKFRDDKLAATVEWPRHLADVKAGTDDDSTPCTTCHRSALHGDPAKTPRVGGEHG